MFFVLDRYFKFLSINLEEDFYLLKDVLKFTFYPNKFISFSIPFSGVILNLLIFFLIVIVFLNIVYLAKKEIKIEIFFWLAIFLGAVSNFIDRIRFSFVVDYIEFFGLSVFNLADVMIVVGCFFVILLNFKRNKKSN